MQLFSSSLYGAEAGNLALKLLPYGGLCIMVALPPKIPFIPEEVSCVLLLIVASVRFENVPVHILKLQSRVDWSLYLCCKTVNQQHPQ